MSVDLNTSFARTLVDEWVAAGVGVAAVSPGSRSTPLALALAQDGRIDVQVFLDERSASFFALGVGKATGRPAVAVCTSGTAAAHFHAAVLEASHSRVPLLACTADRPPELRDTGAGQAVDQLKLYGDAVRWFAEVGVPDDRPGAGAYWRSVAARAVAAAQGPPAGPVHLNLAFREPLVPTGGEVRVAPGRGPVTAPARLAPDAETVDGLAELVAAHPRGVLVAGWGAGLDPGTADAFARRAGWPVLADPLSGLRSGPHAVSTYDALLRAPGLASGLAPTLAVRVGAALTSKAATAWLGAGVRHVVVDPEGTWLDPHRVATDRIGADPGLLLTAVTDRLAARGDTQWLQRWLRAEGAARHALDGLLDSWDEPFEGRVARDLVASLPSGATLVVGSSMPVRDVESFARPRTGLRVLSNRGVNGIDGFVSTVLGVAAASSPPVLGLCGDLTFLHDANGLLGCAGRGIDATFVVVDNDGGGIFSFLPQTEGPAALHFELLFGTPHGLDLAALAALHGVGVERVARAGELGPAVERAVKGGGVRLVLVRTDRAANVARHRDAWQAVAAALDPA